MSKFYQSILLIFAFVTLAIVPSSAPAQGGESGRSSLNGVPLPAGAVRVGEQSVPAEIRETLGKLVGLGGAELRQGASEVLVWSGGFPRSNGSQFARKFSEGLRSGGWTYAVGEETAEFNSSIR